MAGLRLIIVSTVLIELLALCTISYWKSSSLREHFQALHLFSTDLFATGRNKKSNQSLQMDDIVDNIISQINHMPWSININIATFSRDRLAQNDSVLLKNMTHLLLDSLSYIHEHDYDSKSRFIFTTRTDIDPSLFIHGPNISCESSTLTDWAEQSVPTVHQDHDLYIIFITGCSSKSFTDEYFADVKVDTNGNLLVRWSLDDLGPTATVNSFLQGPLARFIYKQLLTTSSQQNHHPAGFNDWMTDTTNMIFHITVAGDIYEPADKNIVLDRIDNFQRTLDWRIQPIIKSSVGKLMDTQTYMHIIQKADSFNISSLDWSDPNTSYKILKDIFHIEAPIHIQQNTYQWNLLYLVCNSVPRIESSAVYLHDQKFAFYIQKGGVEEDESFPDTHLMKKNNTETNQDLVAFVQSVLRNILSLKSKPQKIWNDSFLAHGHTYYVNFTLMNGSRGTQRWEIYQILLAREKAKLQKLVQDIQLRVSLSSSESILIQTVSAMESLSHILTTMNQDKLPITLDIFQKLLDDTSVLYSSVRANISILPERYQSFSHYFATIGSFILPLLLASMTSVVRESILLFKSIR